LDDNDPYFNNLEELELVDEDVVVDESDKGVTESEEAALDDKCKPYVGLEFRTSDEAYQFYNNYACHVDLVCVKEVGHQTAKVYHQLGLCVIKKGFQIIKRREKCRLEVLPIKGHLRNERG
jgi:hypothetical protein